MDEHILRPQPRRPGTFSLTPISTSSTASDGLEPSPDYSTEPQTPDTADLGFGRKSDSFSRLAMNDRSNGDADGSLGTGQNTPHTTRSFLNLTSSTLLGIYSSPKAYDSGRDETPTPWGAGAQTPARSTSIDHGRGLAALLSAQTAREKAEIGRERKRERSKSMQQQMQRQHWAKRSAGARYAAMLMRTMLLFGFGLAYGSVIAHLHDKRNIAPVKVDSINRGSWKYLGFWGIMGVVLGALLPWMDSLIAQKSDEQAIADDDNDEKAASSGDDEEQNDSIQARLSLGAEWNPIVRSVGAFVGIAFAIRRLPWASTLQVSLTLALVNPVIWYLIDRTSTGFILSTVAGGLGSAILLGINPEWVPSPATASTPPARSVLGAWERITGTNSAVASHEELFMGLASYETIGVATWISSVLFCSCVFFGNIGRRLAFERIQKL